MEKDWNWVSARWWKVDFHAHTTKSNCYGQGPDEEALKQRSAKEWLLDYMRAGIDCVAVTDHNSGDWIDALNQAYEGLSQEANPDFRNLYLFPGVEITVHGNVHILGIFPCKMTSTDINSVVDRCQYRGTKGKSDNCTEWSSARVIEEIAKSGGIAIPAHVDQRRGLFHELSGNTLNQVLESPNLFTMELIDTAFTIPQAYHDRKLNWTTVIGSDQHHPSGSPGGKYPGSHFTWIKMSEPSLGGLKLALIDGDLSIKRSDTFSSDPNSHCLLAIEGVLVDDAKYLGRGSTFDYRFNPWLNTIIGGRGTGKSTVLEFLRNALQRRNEIPETLQEEFAKYNQVSSNRDDEGLLTDKARLFVIYRKDGGRFRVNWNASDNQYAIEEETGPDTWTESQGDISQRFPARIYSQKQIFELAKHPHALLRVVDDAPEVNHRDWKQKWNELTTKYLSVRAQEREVQAGLQEEAAIKGQLDDVKRKLAVFESAGHSDVLKTYQLRQNQSKAIENWEKFWNTAAEQIKDVAKGIVPSDIDQAHFQDERFEDKELLNGVAGVQEQFKAIHDELSAIAQRTEDIRQGWADKKGSLSITGEINSASLKYSELLKQLTEADAGNPNEYGRLVKQRQELEEKLKSFDTKRDSLQNFQQDAAACLEEIRIHRERITQLRKNFLGNVLQNNSFVKIEVVPYGNRHSVEEEFRKLIERSNGGFERDIGSAGSDEGLLSGLNDQRDVEDSIARLKDTVLKLHGGDNTSDRDHRFAAHIQGLPPENIDRLMCWYPKDSLDVFYSLKDGDAFKPVQQGSPGQKTAALLAFLLSYGNEPLVLDQPEDDLDNHLIYDLIVTQLREIKQRRQVIVVTHNANIVANGDSENVVALDVCSGQTRIVIQGGLQDELIRDEICRVMEGGKKAFDQRYKRLNMGKV